MPITDRISDVAGKKIGPLPVGGWAAIGVGTVVIVMLARGRGGGGGDDTVTIPDGFSGISDNVGTGGGGTTVPTPTAPVTPSPTTPGTVKIRIAGKTNVYDIFGKWLAVIGAGSTVYTATRVTVAGKKFYKFKAKSGNWRLVPQAATTVKVVP